VSAVLSLAKPHRIKASHRRRWKGTTGHSVYIMNNPLAGTDPTGYTSCTGKNDGADCAPVTETHREAPTGSHTKSNVTTTASNSSGSASVTTNNFGHVTSTTTVNNNGAMKQAPKQASRERDTYAHTPLPLRIPSIVVDQWRSPAPPTGLAGVAHDVKDFISDIDVEKELSPFQMVVPMEGAMFPMIRGVSSNAPVVIGETMVRVEQAAAKIPGAKILDDMPDFSAMGMSPQQVTSAMMQYNRKWILDQLRSGRTIIDIGVDKTRKIPSIFYQMEKEVIKNYRKLHPEAKAAVENAR
jgi:hypothetical protein